MLWLQFPKDIDIPSFVATVGRPLETLGDLEEEDVERSILVHVVYSTDEAPRAVIHDETDEFFVPVNVSGLSVCESYLLPRQVVTSMMRARAPVSQPGPFSI